MPSDQSPRITDPQRIRALAHPLRMELLDALEVHGELTATQCAELTGESVASCSFHLRMLAKYGFIEPAPPRGREKPWRSVGRSRMFDADYDSPASVHAMQEMASMVVEREAQRIHNSIARGPHEGKDWINALRLTTSAFWATAEEATEIAEKIAELTDPYRSRWEDPDQRPDGARVVRLFGAVTVDPEPAAGEDRGERP